MSVFDKQQYEECAVHVLNNLFPAAFSFEKRESPDWVDLNHQIGLEVVRAETPTYGARKSFSNQNLGENFCKIPSKDWDKHKDFCHLDDSGNLIAVSLKSDFSQNTSRKDMLECIGQAFEHKTDLLNKDHFQKFDDNWLFIYLDNSLDQEDMSYLQQLFSIAEAKSQHQFSRVFIFALDTVWDLQLQKNCIDLHRNEDLFH